MGVYYLSYEAVLCVDARSAAGAPGMTRTGEPRGNRNRDQIEEGERDLGAGQVVDREDGKPDHDGRPEPY